MYILACSHYSQGEVTIQWQQSECSPLWQGRAATVMQWGLFPSMRPSLPNHHHKERAGDTTGFYSPLRRGTGELVW